MRKSWITTYIQVVLEGISQTVLFSLSVDLTTFKIRRTMENEQGTAENPWVLKTPSGSADYTMHKDETRDPPILVCTVGKTVLHYDLRCINDLHAMLKKHGDWMELGSSDEQKTAKEGTVEEWGRSADNPIGGWYGLKKGFRGRFGMYLPPLLELLGLAEVEHNPRNNRMKAI